MESTVSIEQFREELQSWKHELSSIKEEIRHFERNLGIMAAKKIPRELLAQVEHFQNLFICQKEVIDKLRHDLPDSGNKVENIFNNLRSLVGGVGTRGGFVQDDAQPDPYPADPEDRMNTFRKIYSEIKRDFQQFESDWM
ncbi:MAG TPA: hypothetical protein VK563_08055 [Puia sp.]|nr:hypothetical protein [Puia sp.]